jgi:polyisoprenoid-binding protein YceI
MAKQTWNIDPSHSGLHFSVRHMMIAKVRGAFTQWGGQITLDDDLTQSSVQVSAEVASINTADEKRDGHLKSPDFFDAAKFPKMTFASKRVEGKGDQFKVVGDLSLHGVTHEVTLEVHREGAGKDPWGNERQAFSVKGHLNRYDFDLKWNQALETGGVLVGEKVEVESEISAVKAK